MSGRIRLLLRNRELARAIEIWGICIALGIIAGGLVVRLVA